MSYDDKSYELAEYFLDSWTHTPQDVDDLANEIQSAVELWFKINEERVTEQRRPRTEGMHRA